MNSAEGHFLGIGEVGGTFDDRKQAIESRDWVGEECDVTFELGGSILDLEHRKAALMYRTA